MRAAAPAWATCLRRCATGLGLAAAFLMLGLMADSIAYGLAVQASHGSIR